MATWVVEQNVFSEKCFDEMIEHFRSKNIPYHVVKVIPFIHDIDGPVPSISGPVVVYGSIGVQKLAAKHNWKPGVFGDRFSMSETHAIENLKSIYLNEDAVRTNMSCIKQFMTEDQPYFLKPDTDTKEFAGTVIAAGEFQSWYDNMMSIGYLDDNDFPVVLSSPKQLGCEWRVVVVDGKISTYSLYRQYQRVKPERHILPEVEELVYEAHRLYQPAPVYVVDVAQVKVDDEWKFKVIEYNTFNSAGFYECDVAKIIDDVSEYVNSLNI